MDLLELTNTQGEKVYVFMNKITHIEQYGPNQTHIGLIDGYVTVRESAESIAKTIANDCVDTTLYSVSKT